MKKVDKGPKVNSGLIHTTLFCLLAFFLSSVKVVQQLYFFRSRTPPTLPILLSHKQSSSSINKSISALSRPGDTRQSYQFFSSLFQGARVQNENAQIAGSHVRARELHRSIPASVSAYINTRKHIQGYQIENKCLCAKHFCVTGLKKLEGKFSAAVISSVLLNSMDLYQFRDT